MSAHAITASTIEQFNRRLEILYRLRLGEPQYAVAREMGVSTRTVRNTELRLRTDARLREALEKRMAAVAREELIGDPPW